MLELDGSDGGGQLVRTALSLSALTATPFEMDGVRGERSTPGLGAQHLAGVEAVAAVTDADVETGDEDGGEPAVGTESFVFEPGPVAGGEYAVDIGTAGSVTLLVDAVLPLATALDEPLRLTVVGGTDVAWSPPVDYLRHVKLPLLRGHGLQASLSVERRGFYPEGGGAVTLQVAPSSLMPVAPVSASRETARIYSTASDDLASDWVADRQVAAATGLLEDAGVEVVQRVAGYWTSRSTGSALVVQLDGGSDAAPVGFGALGAQGRPAEDVAEDAVEAALSFRAGPGAVDGHMADQLVPYLALAGGEVAIPAVTDHVETVVALVEAFGYEVGIDRRAEGAVVSA